MSKNMQGKALTELRDGAFIDLTTVYMIEPADECKAEPYLGCPRIPPRVIIRYAAPGGEHVNTLVIDCVSMDAAKDYAALLAQKMIIVGHPALGRRHPGRVKIWLYARKCDVRAAWARLVRLVTREK